MIFKRAWQLEKVIGQKPRAEYLKIQSWSVVHESNNLSMCGSVCYNSISSRADRNCPDSLSSVSQCLKWQNTSFREFHNLFTETSPLKNTGTHRLQFLVSVSVMSARMAVRVRPWWQSKHRSLGIFDNLSFRNGSFHSSSLRSSFFTMFISALRPPHLTDLVYHRHSVFSQEERSSYICHHHALHGLERDWNSQILHLWIDSELFLAMSVL